MHCFHEVLALQQLSHFLGPPLSPLVCTSFSWGFGTWQAALHPLWHCNIPLHWQPLLTESLPQAWSCAGYSTLIPHRHYYSHFMADIIITRWTLSHWWNRSGSWDQWHIFALWPESSRDVRTAPADGQTWLIFLMVWADNCTFSTLKSPNQIRTTWARTTRPRCCWKYPLILSGKTQKAPALKLAAWELEA